MRCEHVVVCSVCLRTYLESVVYGECEADCDCGDDVTAARGECGEGSEERRLDTCTLRTGEDPGTEVGEDSCGEEMVE